MKQDVQEKPTLMLGNQAFAQGAYEAGVGFISSYPGTPSTEISEYAAKFDEIQVEWAPNEKVALESSIGASVAGMRSMSCMKHVGLNVAADPLFTSAYIGVNAGHVVIVADDPGCYSSQNEQDSRYYAMATGLPMLEPSDSSEARDFVIKAYELSERFGTPVIIRSNTRLGHSRCLVKPGKRAEISVKEYVKDAVKRVMMPAMAVKAHVALEKRVNELKEFAYDTELNRIEIRDTKIGIITNGVAYQYVREAMPNASVLKLGLTYPLSEKLIKEFASKVEELYVVEELEPIFEMQIKAMGISVKGKELFTIQGEYSANMVKKAFTGNAPEFDAPGNIPARPPIMCPGCPHRGVYYILSKNKYIVCGDIGCYTLGALAPLATIDTVLCMGASISMAGGMEKARGHEFAKKLVAVIGDSTFLHSGITGLLNLKYNGSTSTVMILDNSTTGMTGHQDNPATGKDAKGNPAPAVDIEALVRSLGIERVKTVDPFDVKLMEKTIKEETACGELSVIISKRPCALIDKTKKPLYMETDKCRNCGACMKLGCPAILKLKEGIKIVSTMCAGCGLCSKVCPFGAIEEVK